MTSAPGSKPARLRACAAPSVFKTVAAFCAEYEALSYVVEPIIRTSSVYTSTARTGGGKTGLQVSLGLAVATGRRELVGMDVEQGRVAYLAFENPDDVRMRFKIASWYHNIDLDALGDQLIIVDARKRPEEIVAVLQAHGGPFSLVILDTLAAGFDGRDINDNVASGEYVRRLRPITQIQGQPALLIAAHPVKNASDDQLVPYGGGAILNEVDGNLTLSKKTGSDVTVLHHQGKFRGLEFEPRRFRFDLVSSPDMVDKRGRQVVLPVLLPAADETIELREAQEIDRPIAILKALAVVTKATLRELVAQTGIPKTSIERHVAALKAKKLVEADRREGLRITAKGATELEKTYG